MRKKRKYRPEGYTCPVPNCNATFPTPQSLGGHVTSVHTEADLEAIIREKERLKLEKMRARKGV